MKKLTAANNNLLKDDCDVGKLTDQLHMAEAKYDSLKEHVISSANALTLSLESDQSDNTTMPDLTRQTHHGASSRVLSRSEASHRSPAEAPRVPQVLGTRVRTCSVRASTSSAPYSSSPQVVVIGGSLVRDQGKILQRRGVDCTCFTYSGGVLPYIRTRVPDILNEQCQPEFVHLVCGRNDLDLTNQSVENVCQAYERLISDVKRCSPRSKVVVNTIPPRRESGGILTEKIHLYVNLTLISAIEVHMVTM